MKVLIAASEVAPIIKIGGLGDVIGSLPKALEKLGVDVDVVVPFFPSAKTQGCDLYKSMDLNIPFNGENNVVEVFKTTLPNSNVGVILLKNDRYFASGGVNFYAKSVTETEMFTFFDRSVVEFIKAGFNTYDLIHCNDWHTGLITHLLQDEIPDSRPATLFTIHNLMYQGIGDPSVLKEAGIVPGSHPLIDWDISDGDLNMMQQGITSSDYINAVSVTYAQEILTTEFGSDFADILLAREGRLCGILNGLDYSAFPRDYTVDNWKEGKAKKKAELIQQLGLKASLDTPLISFIGRIDPNQKGIDLILEVIPELVKKGAVFTLLGTGLPEWEKKIIDMSNTDLCKGKFIPVTKFDINIANLMYSASDFLAVPSKYEPCGLIQMIAVWYGSLPIVHAVGGLKDTIKEEFNGFTFEKYTSQDFMSAITRALEVYKNHNQMDTLVTNAMKCDFSWNLSAKKYLELYNKVVEIRKSAHESLYI
jgi:starch synthase